MIKRILPIAALGVALLSNTGCGTKGSDLKHVKGVDYKVLRHKEGPLAKIGDVVEFQILATVDTMAGKPADTLGDSRKMSPGITPAIPVEEVQGNGMWQAVIPFLAAGDSAEVSISCDTLIENIKKTQPNQKQLPPWLKSGNKIKVLLSIISIKSKEQAQKDMEAKRAQMQKEMEDKAAAQMPIDDKALQDYFAKNNIKATKTASGLYYVINKPGSGANAHAGQMVSMKYIGKTLEGKQFDANMDESGNLLDKGGHKEPFSFGLGQGQVIKGWDEGIALLNKGAKATLYIPSPLAYGTQSPSPDIAPNSVLVFNVEVVDIKAMPERPMPNGPQGQGQQPQQ